jgi:hypothetical protein
VASGGGKGQLIRAALQFLRKARRRNRPGRMTPHFRQHTFMGDVRPGNVHGGSGYHYRPGGQDFPGRRIRPGTTVRDTRTGVYRAEPEFYDPQLGTWKPKAGNGGVSTFYPDHWTPAQVDAAVPGAFGNSTRIPGTNMWQGTYGGIRIEGYYTGGGSGFTHGWPVM